MSAYAIVQASGKQFWVEENRFYDFDKLPLNPGDMFKLNRVLFVNKHGLIQIGKPFLDGNCLIEATVIRHLSGAKVRVYKMRPKKKTRKTFGSRPKLTRILVNSISTVTKTSVTCYL
jgi:large subunit ribosomal protein L21